MSEIIVANDLDFKRTLDEIELAQRVGPLLAKEYPGYRWRVEPHPHAAKPFVDIRLETGNARFGWTIKPGEYFSATSFDAAVRKIGGELLERHNLSRNGLDEDQWRAAPRRFDGSIVMDLAK